MSRYGSGDSGMNGHRHRPPSLDMSPPSQQRPFDESPEEMRTPLRASPSAVQDFRLNIDTAVDYEAHGGHVVVQQWDGVGNDSYQSPQSRWSQKKSAAVNGGLQLPSSYHSPISRLPTRRSTRRLTSENLDNRSWSPHHAAGTSTDNASPSDVALRYGLIRLMPHPSRKDGHPPSLREVALFIKKIRRLRRLLSIWFATSTTKSLCPECASLELQDDDFVLDDDESGQPKIRPGPLQFGMVRSLGKLKSIVEKSNGCNLCRLIVATLQEQKRFRGLLANVGSGEQPESVNSLKIDCYVSWSRDQYTRATSPYRPGAGYKTTNSGTRRLKISWHRANVEPFYLGKFMNPISEQLEGAMPVHVSKLKQPSTVALIGRWIDSCKAGHTNRCRIKRDGISQHRSKQGFFGVIDLHEMRLTRLPVGSKYVALSYTWGSTVVYRLEKSNVRMLQANNSFTRILEKLPKVIQDAMSLARALGQRYLWVDSLCIVQDSSKAWQLNANVMGQIYSHAHFTICAADGSGADTGLVAFSGSPAGKQVKSYANRFDLIGSYPAEHYIQNSVWNTRAWTFQERLLSRCSIIFVGQQVFFQCRSTILREETFAGDVGASRTGSKTSPADLLADIANRPLKVYTECVHLYTQRYLTKPDDVLNAFKGVGNFVDGVLGNRGLLFGLPRSHFDWALLWQCKSESQYRGEWTMKNGKAEIQDMPKQFPSWAWCGWYEKDKSVHYDPIAMAGTTTNVQYWLTHHTWITWYVRDKKGDLKLVWSPSEPREDTVPPDSRWAGYQRKDAGGIHSRDMETYDRPESPKYDLYGRPLSKLPPHHELVHGGDKSDKPQPREGDRGYNTARLPRQPGNKQADDFRLTLDEFPFGVAVSDEPEESGLGNDWTATDLPFLQFFTWSAYFTLERFDNFAYELDPGDPAYVGGVEQQQVRLRTEPDPRWAILDYRGDVWGVITPDRTTWKPPVTKLMSKVVESAANTDRAANGEVDADRSGTGAAGGKDFDLYFGEHQFIAISEAKEFSKEEADGWMEYLPTEAEGLEWNLYYVLLVAEVDGVCYRLGLGKIYKDAFEFACRGGKEWKEIILG